MAGESSGLISVIIPTIGRPELTRAVASAVAQEGVSIEVIVVVDAAEQAISIPEIVREQAKRVLWTGGGRGGSHARNLGVKAASGNWVAFLDDDDEWLPIKSSSQLAAAEMDGGDLVVMSSRHRHIDVRTSRQSKPVPRRTIEPHQRVEEYLFRRRRPAGGRASMYTSTLMCTKAVADAVAWDPSRRRHQDWDWLVRAGRLDGVRFIHHPSPLVLIQTGSSQSVSAGVAWEPSLQWADEILREDAGVYVDFVVGQTLRYAIASRSMSGILRCIRRVWARRTVPSWGPIMIALGGLLPRRTVELILARVR